MIYKNDLTSAICDMWDIKRSVPKDIQKLPKDNQGTDYTIGECIDDVLDYLEKLQELQIEKGDLFIVNNYGGEGPNLERYTLSEFITAFNTNQLMYDSMEDIYLTEVWINKEKK